MDVTPWYDSQVAAAIVATVAALGGAGLGAWWNGKTTEKTASADRAHFASEAARDREFTAGQARATRLQEARLRAYEELTAYIDTYRRSLLRAKDEEREMGTNVHTPVMTTADLGTRARQTLLVGSDQVLDAYGECFGLIQDCEWASEWGWPDAWALDDLLRDLQVALRRDLGAV